MATSKLKLDRETAKNALLGVGIKPTTTNINKAAALAPTIGPVKGYVDKVEISAGARILAEKLAKEVKLDASQSLSSAITKVNVPGYSITYQADQSSIVFDPALSFKGPMAKAAGAGPHAKPTDKGGLEITIGDKNKAFALEKGKWVKVTLSSLAHGTKAADQLKKLEAAGYDIHALRDVLVVKDETGKKSFFAVREHPRFDGPSPGGDTVAAEPSGPIGGAYHGPGFGPAPQMPDSTRGLVALSEHCTEVQILGFKDGKPMITIKKPVVYLYPEQKTRARVEVHVKGEFIAQYPETEHGVWDVIATPDGMLFDPKTERRFSYIFWEAENSRSLSIDPSQAFVVPRDDVEGFLERSARQLGLNDRERTDFVSFWIAPMKRNALNLVQFLVGDECNAYATMTVEPRPDSEIRMFMLFRSIERPLTVGAPTLPALPRKGFTVVEWGGTNLDE